MTPTIEQAIDLWKDRVFNQAQQIDPNDEEDWRSMAIGFGFGQGFSIPQVHLFVTELDKRRLF